MTEPETYDLTPEDAAYNEHKESCEQCSGKWKCPRGEMLYGKAYNARVMSLRLENMKVRMGTDQ